MLERDVEAYLIRRVEGAGGECIKFKPIRAGLPDRLVFLPGGRFALVELKQHGKKREPVQEAWHRRFVELGFNSKLIDSKQSVDDFMGD